VIPTTQPSSLFTRWSCENRLRGYFGSHNCSHDRFMIIMPHELGDRNSQASEPYLGSVPAHAADENCWLYKPFSTCEAAIPLPLPPKPMYV
jgi:hypothetical protein